VESAALNFSGERLFVADWLQRAAVSEIGTYTKSGI
jgi:hypothetical protein